MEFVTYVLAFIVAVGIIVTVHEFGHYWVAKKLGVKVLRFSVGFGKPLLTRFGGGADNTEYVLASIPLGGYVKMLDEREGEVAAHELPRAFNKQNVWKRFAIVSAGPIFNFIFAVFAYWITFVAGVDGVKPTVGEIQPESIAANAQIQQQDTFTHIDGEAVSTWQETSIQMLNSALKTGSVTATLESKDSSANNVRLDLSDTKHLLSEGNLLEKIGITPWRYQLQARFGEIKSGAAKTAGIMEGDKVISVDGQNVATWTELVKYIQARANVPIQFELNRNDKNLITQVTPAEDKQDGRVVGRIGAYPYIDHQQLEAHKVVVKYGLFESIGKAFVKTWEVSILTLKLLWKLVVGEASLKNISGPVTIAEYAGVSAAIGFSAFVGALAIISISIGILNLLPIPVLDGGHLFYYIIEMLKGSPVSEKFEAAGQRVGIIMLAGLMSLAFYNDIYRLLQ
ncbi:MAG: RIP metalloprotease RseP [Pseudomonadota bacterium]